MFHRRESSKPAQKFYPELSDTIYVRVNGGWQAGEVIGANASREMFFAETEDGATHSVRTKDYPIAWCWPHDMINVGHR